MPKYTHASKAGRPFVIYALVCPTTREVKYVGQTGDLDARMTRHWPSAHQGTMRDWLLSLGQQRPVVVVLEKGVNRFVRLRVREGNGKNRWRNVWFSTVRETIWQVRHRRTILNIERVESSWVAQPLTNPPLPWDDGYEYEREELDNGAYRIKPCLPRAIDSKGDGVCES